MNKFIIICLAFTTTFLFSCVKKVQDKNSNINVHISGHPESLHPYHHISRTASHIAKHLYQPLIDKDYYSGKMVPVLAESLAEIEKKEDGTIHYLFKINSSATWDNGEAINVDDVLFSVKAFLLPIGKTSNNRSHFNGIINVKKGTSTREVIFVCDHTNNHLDGLLSNFYILPKKHFDFRKKLDDITIKEILAWEFKSKGTKDIIEDYVNDFQFKIQDKLSQYKGSGPYSIEKWTVDGKITLAKKKEWWGNNRSSSMFFENTIERINYIVELDRQKAVSSVMLGKIDIMAGATSDDLAKLKNSEVFSTYCHVFSPTKYAYSYLGFNLYHDILKDVRLRELLTMSIDKQDLIDKIMGGYAVDISGPLHPQDPNYNKAIKKRAFDVAYVNEELTKMGWIDFDHNGYRSKLVNNEVVELKLTLNFAKNYTARKIGEYIQDAFKAIGVKVILHEMEFNSFLTLNKKHEFDLILSSNSSYARNDDPKFMWHSKAYNYGQNWMGFGNARSDELLEKIDNTADLIALEKYEKELQKEIDQQLPCLFLFAPQHKIIMSKSISHPKVASIGLGFWESNLTKN